ncbi:MULTISPECIES: FAD-dependent oxidoreductase [Actinosynnema]|uniref:FAD-dependent oxidoreductase n=1 Tax=Actinosynnema TaxID=40566 RepID=UPI0020A28EA0|nr:FAD-dependent oxidoreductase [Actinosynnema pretiosum]MCP2094782.1 2-polyprenyl-6-methoxyphenol hydroxylase [Actinosynnema pretiosum]
MAHVVVAGGGPAGLATALALAGGGHRVTVLERGSPPPPGPAAQAGARWERPTAPQTGHSHTVTSLGVRVLARRAPEVLAALVRAGATVLDLTGAAPGGAQAPPDPGDADLRALACRRATFDVVLHRHVSALPGVEVRHGERVLGLLTSPSGDRVAGVRADTGDLPADLVVDATGKRALGRRWLAALGVEPAADLVAPSSVSAYARFYRAHGGPGPLNRGNAAGVLGDHCACVLHPGDNGTFSIAFGVLPGDDGLRGLRDPGAFDAAARAVPWVGRWLELGATPITPVRVITCPSNSVRATALAPPLAGLLPVGDSACVTDPLFGRGLSLLLAHAFRLADLVAAHPDLGRGLSGAAATSAAELLLPWYRQAEQEGRDRATRWRAAAEGVPPTGAVTTPLRAAGAVAGRDRSLWRGVTRVLMGLDTPDEVFGDAGFAARVRQELAAAPPAPTPGIPSRAELMAATGPEVSESAHAGSSPR